VSFNVGKICLISKGPVLSVKLEHWSFLPPQHLLGIPQLLSGLPYVEFRAPSPLDNRRPEPDRFACVVPANHVVSSRTVKLSDTKQKEYTSEKESE